MYRYYQTACWCPANEIDVKHVGDRRQPEDAASKSLICSVEIYAGSIYRERAYGYCVAPRKMYTDLQN